MEVVPPIAKDEKNHSSDVLLFNRWTYDAVQVSDIFIDDYITATASKNPIYIPHTAGRYKTRFRKAQCPVVERLTKSLMMHGRNNGKKLMVVRTVKHAMEIIHLLTDANPIQIIIDAVINRMPLTAAYRRLLVHVGDQKYLNRWYLNKRRTHASEGTQRRYQFNSPSWLGEHIRDGDEQKNPVAK